MPCSRRDAGDENIEAHGLASSELVYDDGEALAAEPAKMCSADSRCDSLTTADRFAERMNTTGHDNHSQGTPGPLVRHGELA